MLHILILFCFSINPISGSSKTLNNYLSPLERLKVIDNAISKVKIYPATITPCCVDTLSVCRKKLEADSESFLKACRLPDFSFMQCCYTCHFNSMAYVGLAPSGAELYDHDVSNLLLNIGNGMNPHCFDRRGPEFCESLLQRKGRWHNRQLTCSNSPAIAFRVCRKSCGFCSDHQTTSSVRWLSEESLDRKKCTSIIS